MPNGKLNLTSFVAGIFIGAAAALLLAPQSGKRTRKEIAHFGKMGKKKGEALLLEFRHKMENVAEDVSEKLDESIQQGREWSEEKMQQIEQALESGKGFIRNEIDKVFRA